MRAALAAWGRAEVTGLLTGGNRNPVLEIRLDGRPAAVVHGDPGPSNIRVGAAGPGLLDWDESRVDYTDLDLADLPGSDLRPARLTAARAAAAAWEAANGWMVEPSYARRQLARLRSLEPAEE